MWINPLLPIPPDLIDALLHVSQRYDNIEMYVTANGLTWVDHETGGRCWKKRRCYLQAVCKRRMVNEK